MLILLVMTAICWAGGLLIDRENEEKIRKLILTATVVLMLAILGYFKYTGFFLEILQGITGFPKAIPTIVLPIGISFYTFQLLSYVVDVYREEVPAQPYYWKLLLYSSLFHQCIAGPIVRYQHVAEEIDRRRIKMTEMAEGDLALYGRTCQEAHSRRRSGSTCRQTGAYGSCNAGVDAGAWRLVRHFMLYVPDISGFCRIFGHGDRNGKNGRFHYHENFNYPYVANSVTEFWRRWHISLSTFSAITFIYRLEETEKEKQGSI